MPKIIAYSTDHLTRYARGDFFKRSLHKGHMPLVTNSLLLVTSFIFILKMQEADTLVDP